MKSKLKRRCVWGLVNLLRFLLALTFIFSGTVKLIDPHGTEYKIQDYGEAFGLSGLLPTVVPLFLSIVLAAIEFSMGIYMLFGMSKRKTAYSMFVFMLFFTPLTLYLALFNPVSDCGCFGDALKLSNWQTFWKNVVLLLSALIVLFNYRRITTFITHRNQWSVSLYTWTFALVFSGVSLAGLPIIDFRPYHIGANLRMKMEEELKNAPKLETYFILEKDGLKQEFTLDNYPDSTWNFIDSRTVAVGEQTENTEISDLRICTVQDGEDITNDVLQNPGYTFLLISPYLEKADDGEMDRILVLHDYCIENGYDFYCLTSSGNEAIEEWSDMTGAEYVFCHTDAIVLKTMVRSNPGLILLHDGMVVNKWVSSKLPKSEELNAPLERLPLSQPHEQDYMNRIIRILLFYILPLIFFTLVDRVWVVWKLRNLHKYCVINKSENNEKENRSR